MQTLSRSNMFLVILVEVRLQRFEDKTQSFQLGDSELRLSMRSIPDILKCSLALYDITVTSLGVTSSDIYTKT